MAVISGRVLQGTVVSNLSKSTLVVKVDRSVKHSIYGKFRKVGKKFHAHVDDERAFQVGQTVDIVECRPMSRLKRWRVLGGRQA